MKPPVEFKAALAEASKHIVLAGIESSDPNSWDVADHMVAAMKRLNEASRHWNAARKNQKGH